MSAEPAFDVDVAVVGAGLTGLSFVAWLEQLTATTGRRVPTVRLIDPRESYNHDRSWCFWEGAEHPFADGITHRWQHWQVMHAGKTVSASAVGHPYALLPADRLYRLATDCIERHPEFQLNLGQRVEAIEPVDQRLLVHTNDATLRVRSVIDTRPPTIHETTARAGLWQVFHGLEITLDHDCFDASTATLMHFQDDDDEIRFLYILPMSSQRALIELTAFRRTAHTADLLPRLNALIAARFGHQAQCVRSEHGMLPMMPLPASATTDPRIIAAGTVGGWMRPASGYLFSACQRGTQDLAQQALTAVERGSWRWRKPRVRPPDLDFLDRVFLRALRDSPAKAPSWFLRLFDRTKADRPARFLSDEPTLADRLAIIASLPALPMLRSAIRCVRGLGDSR